MRKLLVILLLLFAFSSIKAQGIPLEYAVRMAMNMSQFDDNFPRSDAERQYRLGLMAGVVASYMIYTQMALSAELFYMTTGGIFKSSSQYYSSKSTYIFQYIALNFLYRYYVWRGLAAMIGPQIGFLLSADQKWKSDHGSNTTDIKKEINPMALGLVLGAAWQFPCGVLLDFRYRMGLNNIWKSKFDYKMRQTMLVFTVAYVFNLLSPSGGF